MIKIVDKTLHLFLLLLLFVEAGNGQGLNHNFLLGYDTGLFGTHVISTKAILGFDSTSVTVDSASFKMPFDAAQSNISDANGKI